MAKKGGRRVSGCKNRTGLPDYFGCKFDEIENIYANQKIEPLPVFQEN